jgi:hypothetical protein
MKRLFFSLVIICMCSLFFFTCEDAQLPLESESQTGQPSLVVANVMEDALSEPIIVIAEGSDFVAAGVGMVNQPATLNITIPDNVIIKQVLLYWTGGAVAENHGVPNEGDDEILIDGKQIPGELIGGPTYFFNVNVEEYYFSTYRADITDEELVSPGVNSLSISGMEFNQGTLNENNGVGIFVIYDDEEKSADIQLRDGQDLAYIRFEDPLDHTEPQTFTFEASDEERTAKLLIFSGSVARKVSDPDAPRDNKIVVTVNGVTTEYDNELGSFAGDAFDAKILLITIPAGASELTVELISVENNAEEPENSGASLSWITAGLSIPKCEIELAAIGDFVWIDMNMNGIQDEGEPGKKGVTVNLYDCQDNFLTSTTTDNDGLYLFFNLIPGDYYIEFEKPADYVFTLQDQGGDDNKDSDADPATGKTICTELEEGETDLTWDAGLYQEEKVGCTRTQGYWKTHAGENNKKRDATWDLIGEDKEYTTFFLSKQTYYDVMHTNPSGGNAYYILAHQYIAAHLNVLSGASIPDDVLAAWNEATNLFDQYTPEEIGELEGEDVTRQQFIDIAELLDDYNNGVIGPGHCE